MIKQKRPIGMYRLFVRIRDKDRPLEIDKVNNVQNTPVKWKEVSEISIGSVSVPNKDIFEVKWVWEEFEPDGSRMSASDFLGKFFKGSEEID